MEIYTRLRNLAHGSGDGLSIPPVLQPSTIRTTHIYTTNKTHSVLGPTVTSKSRASLETSTLQIYLLTSLTLPLWDKFHPLPLVHRLTRYDRLKICASTTHITGVAVQGQRDRLHTMCMRCVTKRLPRNQSMQMADHSKNAKLYMKFSTALNPTSPVLVVGTYLLSIVRKSDI